jgi:preflagellin peptidase FlaK
MIDYILVLIALIYLIFASISDIKTREVPDWLSYSLVVIALFLRLFYSIESKDIMYFVYGVIGMGVFLGIGLLMYYGRQWGGGDVKLITALGTAFGTAPKISFLNPNLDLPFLVILFINMLFFGAIYGLTWSFVLALRNRKKVWRSFKELFKSREFRIKRILFYSFSLFLLIVSLFFEEGFKIIFLILALLVFVLYHILVFVKAVDDCCMIKEINTSKLTEGDWIIKKVYYKGKKIYDPERLGLTRKYLDKLKKYKIRVLIKEGIPFVPSFLIGLIISLIVGNFIFVI